MKYLILIVMLFQFGCMTTGNERITSSARLKYNCTKVFVQENVKFSQASKWCSVNFRSEKNIEGE